MSYLTVKDIKKSRELGKTFLELERQIVEYTSQSIDDKLIRDIDEIATLFKHPDFDLLVQLSEYKLEENNIYMTKGNDTLFIMPQIIKHPNLFGLRATTPISYVPIVNIVEKPGSDGLLRKIGEGLRLKNGHYQTLITKDHKYIVNIN